MHDKVLLKLQGGVDSLADVEELPDGVTIRAEPMSPPIPHEVDEWEIPSEEIELGPRVGIGSFGEVYRGTWRLTDVAVKRFLEQDLKPENIEVRHLSAASRSQDVKRHKSHATPAGFALGTHGCPTCTWHTAWHSHQLF